ncbi:acyl-CoA dehydrogenase family protein [Conexibacter stalactiti]|uniref:Acyl-CoA dehydrogenase family protein n=1 Tax=Conexibacter stalactiti TaxID=1940611 RepID=A0ABU4HNG7_9ACTN|nr:acyl-CoA dehydrogenase family protein [Conexibacter stalactiti]MDW5594254.1 acyl-CoA dehydrogenase family protein [Conexibacter stalactiti]MEC5034896.1 acyl-CoA dehydrogenase family protein [Conexibacter stalactiti]
MAFELSEEQRELAGTVDRLLADTTGGPRGRQLLARPDGWRELWEALADLGVLAMGVPEEAGGLGLGPVELVAVAEAVGRHLAPAPIVATAGAFVPTVALVAGETAAGTAALRAVAEQQETGALAWPDPRTAGADAAAGGDAATPRVRDGRLTASLVVPDAALLDRLALVVADDDRGGAEAIVLLDRADLALEPAAAIDETHPLARVTVADADVAGRRFPAPPGALATAFATAAAELVGLADALLRMSVDYAGERQQFGAPIGSFQALKHRLADTLIAVERARSLTWHAAVLAAEQPLEPATAAAAHFAKAAASDAATIAARAAVQVHGGIGITREHDVSLLYLRARQASFQLGGADAHQLAAVAEELADAR